MLDIEFKYYRNNHSRLQEKYPNKFIVIKGKKVVGTYNSHSEAYYETVKNEELGTFLIQRILNDDNSFKTKRNRLSFFNIITRQKLRV